MRVALVFAVSAETLQLIRKSLEQNYRIEVVSDAASALERIASDQPDVFLIDLGIDGEPGLSLGGQVRATERFNAMAIIYLASFVDTAMTVRAFESGGDDLVRVPFEPEELLARVEARFKRLRLQPIVHDLFWKADLRFSLGRQRVVCTDSSGERDLELTPNEFRILYLLARNEGLTLSRQVILDEVWGESLHVV